MAQTMKSRTWVLLLLGACWTGMAHTQESRIRVIEVNDHILAFYAGRDPNHRLGKERNWADLSAMDLGVVTYAIYKGEEAVVHDTFPSSEQARWVRDHLEDRGIKRFTVVLSHWHLDHVGGNDVYKDSHIIATRLTRDTLALKAEKIKSGALWGLPALPSLTLPDITFEGRLDFYIDDLKLELHNINLHSVDSNYLYIPSDKILFAGDGVEDSLVFAGEVVTLPEQIENLKELKTWDIERIYPSHGDPEVIGNGGYSKTFIDATIDYISKLLARAGKDDFLEGTMEDYLSESLAKGWIHHFEPYRVVHQRNLRWIYDYHHGKASGSDDFP